jgi:sugar O-acyltransferase (sialic acid O-acetyltransferase NeuD family)
MNEERILLVGCGGHASVLVDLLEVCGLLPDVLGCTDRPGSEEVSFCGLPILGSDADIRRIADKEPLALVVGVGSGRDMVRRTEVVHRLDLLGLPFRTLVHPSAVVSRSVRIGEGAAVMAGAIINAGATVGRLAVLNTGCIVEHGCQVGDNTLIGPGAVLSGQAKVGSDTLVGSLAVVLPGVRVGDRCVVAAGAVVTRDVPDDVRVAGVPARNMEEKG